MFANCIFNEALRNLNIITIFLFWSESNFWKTITAETTNNLSRLGFTTLQDFAVMFVYHLVQIDDGETGQSLLKLDNIYSLLQEPTLNQPHHQGLLPFEGGEIYN